MKIYESLKKTEQQTLLCDTMQRIDHYSQAFKNPIWNDIDLDTDRRWQI
jgi:hypothetical protein